jgi:hypothetical protein
MVYVTYIEHMCGSGSGGGGGRGVVVGTQGGVVGTQT